MADLLVEGRAAQFSLNLHAFLSWLLQVKKLIRAFAWHASTGGLDSSTGRRRLLCLESGVILHFEAFLRDRVSVDLPLTR